MLHVFGVVGKIVKGGSNLYTVNWNYMGLKAMDRAFIFSLPVVLLAADVKRNRTKLVEQTSIEVLFNNPGGDIEGNPLGSDYKMDGDEFGEEVVEEKK
eukprot:14660340-Ditylum_brightwellii.AAC.1